jgi:hypothetical protein
LLFGFLSCYLIRFPCTLAEQVISAASFSPLASTVLPAGASLVVVAWVSDSQGARAKAEVAVSAALPSAVTQGAVPAACFLAERGASLLRSAGAQQSREQQLQAIGSLAAMLALEQGGSSGNEEQECAVPVNGTATAADAGSGQVPLANRSVSEVRAQLQRDLLHELGSVPASADNAAQITQSLAALTADRDSAALQGDGWAQSETILRNALAASTANNGNGNGNGNSNTGSQPARE